MLYHVCYVDERGVIYPLVSSKTLKLCKDLAGILAFLALVAMGQWASRKFAAAILGL